jgi:transposase
MVREGQYSAIKELYATGTPKRAIARFLGIDVKTVRRQLAKCGWNAYQRNTGNQKQLLDDKKSWLIKRIPEVGYNATVLFRELKLKGYEGSYETVKAFVFPYREKVSKACVRYETPPGEQSQVDWGSAWVWLGDKEVKIHFFSLVLGYSRRIYAKGYSNERFMNLIEGHEEAFRWFGGFTTSLLYDNAKTMVTTHNTQTKELILNKQFEDFANHYGFIAKFCTPYRPQTKGKIESGIKYLKRNFLPGRRFRDLEHLNQELEKWILEVADTRIHGTTHERPTDRFATETLIPLKGVKPYAYIPVIQRKVSQDSMISFSNNRYSIPWIYVGKSVDLKIMAGQLMITFNELVIATHDLLAGKHQQSVSQAHYAGLSAPKHRNQISRRPQQDPYWQEENGVAVRDLSVYEEAAFAGRASSTRH